jgi:peroxiredoxin
MVKPGDPAKNFSLKDQNDKTFGLYEQTGNYTLLSFHPLAWTDFCAAQMKSLEDNREVLDTLLLHFPGVRLNPWCESGDDQIYQTEKFTSIPEFTFF